MSEAAAAPPAPGFAEALVFWHRLGWISFGGPAGQIAVMQTELVDRRRWIGQGEFLHALNFCMLLPGPEATQLAAYVGWRLHGWRGAVVAGALFVLPGTLVLWGLSWLIAAHGDARPVAAVLDGIKPMVVAIVLHAVWRIGRRALKGWPAVALAAAAFVAIYFVGIDFPWIVAAAALVGFATMRLPHAPFLPPQHGEATAPDADPPAPGLGRAIALVALFVTLWAAGVGGAIALGGFAPFADIARLFTIAAFVTFGGAYAVLPYVADAAVNDYGWLSAGEMITGLALAETTPGPLILVLQYVGFLAGWQHAGGAAPLAAATLGAALTTYCTFLPSFLFILVGAPYVERLRRSRAAGSALGAITAAVVGVVLNLAAFLAAAVFFGPAGFDWLAAALAARGRGAHARVHVGIHWLVGAGALIGALRPLVG
jgi:chromate transporter